MTTLIIIINIIASLVLIISVLLQSGKGADMGSAFGGGGSQTLFGGAGPTTFLAKMCIVCAVIFMGSSIYLTYHSSKSRTSSVMSAVPSVQPLKAAEKAQPATPGDKALPQAPAQPAQK